MASTRSTRPHLAAILDETRVMERLIDDLRTVALSEAGTLTLHREPTDPDVLIAEVVRSFEGAAGTAGVTVTAEVGDDLPILDVDPVRLREVLANLVANAIRHTPAGGTVVIRGEVAGDRLVLRVADSGSGIDPAVLPHVFDRFVKGAGSGGSGLGLAIARHLVAAHGGTLEVEATGSTGTTFRASLPLHAGLRRFAIRRRAERPGRTTGRVIRTSSTAASTVEADPRSCAANTIRTVCPAHGVIGIVASVQAGGPCSRRRRSSRTSVRVPSAASTYARNTSDGRRIRGMGQVVAEHEVAHGRRQLDLRASGSWSARRRCRTSSPTTRPTRPVTSAIDPDRTVPGLVRSSATGWPAARRRR